MGVKFSTNFEWIFCDQFGSSYYPGPLHWVRCECPRVYRAPSFSGKSVIDGRRDGTGGTKLGRCVFITPISPLFTVPAAFRRRSAFIVRSFYFSPRARLPFSRRYNLYNTTWYFLLDFFRSPPLIRRFLALPFILLSMFRFYFLYYWFYGNQLISLRGA